MGKTASQIGRSNVATAKNHERRVAKLLSDWSGREFRRRRVEGRESDTVLRDLTGDVVPADAKNRCRFNVEAKKGKGFSLNALLADCTSCIFSAWYHQSSYDAGLASKALGLDVKPFVFFKPHPNFDWVAFDVAALYYLRMKDSTDLSLTLPRSRLWFPHLLFDYYEHCGPLSFNISHTKNRKNAVLVPLQLSACFLCTWNDFAANVHPDSFFFGAAWHAADVARNEDRSEQFKLASQCKLDS